MNIEKRHADMVGVDLNFQDECQALQSLHAEKSWALFIELP